MWQLEQLGNVTIVTFAVHQLNEVEVGEFQSRLAAVAREGANVIFDLSRVQFLDSSGLGAIVVAHHRLRNLGGKLLLCCPQPSVQSVFDLVCLGQQVDIHEHRDSALRELGTRPPWDTTRSVRPTRRRAAPNA
ncbi:MAG: STAS domain-containing protein [Planctomycetota bacterium]